MHLQKVCDALCIWCAFFCSIHLFNKYYVAPPSLGTMRTVRPLTRTSEESLVHLLRRMQHFYAVHGINLRTTYEDFDKHHMGIITESQVCSSKLVILYLVKKRKEVNVVPHNANLCTPVQCCVWFLFSVYVAFPVLGLREICGWLGLTDGTGMTQVLMFPDIITFFYLSVFSFHHFLIL